MSVYTGGATELSVSGRYLTFSRSLYFIKTAHYFLMALLYPIQLVRTLYLTVKTIIFFNKAKWHSAKETFSKITLGQFSCFLTEIEIMRNTQKIFIDFLLYDEFAHEYGPVNKATLSTLRLIDRYINRIITSAQKAKRDYDIIILSDHGQTESIPFDQKTNRIIRDIAHALDNDTYSITKTYGGFVPTGDTKEVYVVPAGSTLQLYFSDYLKTGVFEHEIVHRFPQIIKKLLALEEFGWVLVKIDNTTSRLYGKQGTVLLKSNNASLSEGHPFPQLTQDEIEKTIASFGYYSTFPNNGDIVLFGNITSQKKVYSFENHKGTHGGFYGPMVYPFILSTKKYDNVNSMESLFNSIWRGMEA